MGAAFFSEKAAPGPENYVKTLRTDAGTHDMI